MATANELLAAMANSEEERVLVIDNDLRTINIPSRIKALGVEADGDVHRLQFTMPRMYGTTDLSTFNIRINYMNAINEGDIYVVTDKKILTSSITFTWLVGSHAMAYKGNVRFIVCLKDSNSDGTVLREFNTTVTTLPVLEGLEVDAAPLEGELTDVLEQLLSLTVTKVAEVEAAGTAQIAKVQEESSKQQTNIVEKGKEVLATIPEDYQTTAKLADEGARTKADAIICSAEGEAITVADSSDDNLRGLKLFGKTTQEKTTGAQLAYVNINVAGYAYYGVTSTATEDGNILITGTATDRLWNRHASAELIAGETYTLSSNSAIALSVWDATADAEYATKIAGSESITFVAQNTGMYSIVLCNEAGSTLSSVRANIMLNAGNTVLPWEPYTGGVPAPNPEYPQELVSIENPTVNICGKNLVDFACFSGSDNYIALVNVSDLRSVKKGKQYTLSVYLHATAETRAYWNNAARLYGYLEFDVAAGTNRYTYSFTAKEDGDLYEAVSNVVNKYPTSDDVVVTALNAQLEFGDKATEYEPYKLDLLPITTPSTLPGIPVTSGGNYTDANGQQWICDEIDFERGVHIQRIAQYVYDGSEDESWKNGYSSNGINNRFELILRGVPIANVVCESNNAAVVATNAYCSHFGYQLTSTRPAVNNFRISKTVAAVQDWWYMLFVPDTAIVPLEDLDAWKSYLAENPITVMVPLTTPIETPLTADELAAFQALKSNYPNTTVLNDAGAWMNLRYNADTETWITNLIDEKIAAAVAKL